MKATYNVTWEEFAERFQDFWPRPDYFTAIVMMTAAVPLLGYGISLALRLSFENVSSVFIGAPLLLILATIFSLGPEARRKKTAAIAARKAAYEKWPKEQTFSFEEKQWVIENETGRQENFWTTLTAAVELSNVIYLVAGSNLGIVPKRVLSPEDLDSLRRLAHLSAEKGWKYRVRCSDYQTVNMNLLWRKRWFVMTSGNGFCLLVLGWIVQTWISQGTKLDLVWGWILAALAVLLVLTTQLWYLPLRYVTTPRHFWLPQTLQLYASGVSLADGRSTSFLSWQYLETFKEISSAFLLRHEASSPYIVPKRDITLDQQAELRKALQEKMRKE